MIGQVCTFAGNIPLNNRVHGLDIENLDDATLADERQNFEAPWILYNRIRTILFGVVSFLLLKTLLFEPSPRTLSSGAAVGLSGQTEGSNYQSIA